MTTDLDEIRKRTEILPQNFPTTLSVADTGVRSKTPYNLVSVRESLIWRTEELARGACDMLARDDLASGILLTRAVTESAAFIWRLKELLETRGTHAPKDLNEKVLEMIAGWKNDPDFPKATNILTHIKHMDKTVSGIEARYLSLSEFAHPNWSGVAGLFSEIDKENYITRFGKGWSKNEGTKEMATNLLIASLDLFTYAYNAISDNMPTYLSELEPL